MTNRAGARQRRWMAAAAVAAGLFCAGVAVLPTVERHVVPEAGWARLAFRPACHQIRDRCLDLGDGPMPVCARCFGLYSGGFLGLAAAAATGRRLRPGLVWIAAAAAPSVIDFALGFTALPTLGNWPRFAAAAVPAVLAGLLLADAVAEIAGVGPASPDRDRIT